MSKESDIPKATARRLPLYQHAFRTLSEMNTKKISSKELSGLLKIDSATIRRDFSYFGTLGRRGYGYDTEEMLEFFNLVLNREKVTHVAIIGIGNLGLAILRENIGHEDPSIRITAGFDIKEELVNTIYNGIPIYPMDNIKTQLPLLGIDTVVLTVPSEVAQDVTNSLMEADVKGILNFSQDRLTVPDDVRVHNVDLTNELQILIYFMDNY